MKKSNKKNLLLALTAFTLSLGAVAATSITQVSADTPQTVGSINEMSNADYYFKGYNLEWDSDTEYKEDGTATSGKTALRFKMYITKKMYEYISEGSNVTTGTLIYPAYYLEDGLVANLTATTDANGATPLNIVTKDDTANHWNAIENGETVNETAYFYQCSTYLNEIPDEYYTSPIAVRGYVKVGDTYYYTDAENEVARSLSYIANEEYKAATSPLANSKEAFKDALMKFKFKLDDGEVQYKYFGDTVVTAPAEKVGSIDVYTNKDGTAVWNATDTIRGNTRLVTTTVDAKQYYSKATDTATFTATGITAGTQKAIVAGQEIDVTTEEGRVTVSGLNSKGLTVGKNYLMQVGNVKLGFTYVTAVDEYVPYSKNDALWFPALGETTDDTTTTLNSLDISTTGVTVTNLDGEDTREDLYESGPTENNGTITAFDPVLVTSGTDVYKIDPYIYGKVLYTDADAIAYFATGEEYKTGWASVPRDKTYLCTSYFKTHVALARDVDLGESLNTRAVNISLKGASFDGLGHRISWTVDTDTVTNDSQTQASLFGYQWNYSRLANVALDVTYKGTKTTANMYSLIAKYLYSANNTATTAAYRYNAETNPTPYEAIENVAFLITLDATSDSNPRVVLGTNGISAANQTGLNIKDCIFVRNDKNLGTTEERSNFYNQLLVGYAGLVTSTSNNVPTLDSKYSSYYTQITDLDSSITETRYMLNREYMNTDNVVFIVPDGLTRRIGLGSIAGNAYYMPSNYVNRDGGTDGFDGYHTLWSGMFANETYLYKYSEAKAETADTAKQVGGWKISYGDTMDNVDVTYVG